jgi:hypothetical protein
VPADFFGLERRFSSLSKFRPTFAICFMSFETMLIGI